MIQGLMCNTGLVRYHRGSGLSSMVVHKYQNYVTLMRRAMKIGELGGLVARKRGNMGIRAAAREIGISPTTLSKIENGHLPDQKTLNKVCDWLGASPEKFTGVAELQIAFKKKTALLPETSQSLARLISLAREQYGDVEAEGH